MSVKIIVDSASDIKVSFAQQQNLGFAPLRTILGGTEYRDGIDIVPDVFLKNWKRTRKLPAPVRSMSANLRRCLKKRSAPVTT